jgi:hypothetical protein
MPTITDRWADVARTVEDAKGIAWDGCHKIYVLMDDEQMRLMQEYGYGEDGSFLKYASDFAEPRDMLDLLRDWWSGSCELVFISAVRTVPGDPNDGFTNLIPQFADDDD